MSGYLYIYTCLHLCFPILIIANCKLTKRNPFISYNNALTPICVIINRLGICSKIVYLFLTKTIGNSQLAVDSRITSRTISECTLKLGYLQTLILNN